MKPYYWQLIAVEDVIEPVTELNQYHLLEDIATPLARTPYQEQLKIKNIVVRECVNEIRKDCSNMKFSVEILPIAPSVYICIADWGKINILLLFHVIAA